MIMYDQARIIIFNESAGNIIFVKEFEDYIKNSGFAVYLCKKRDPCTKGKVENTVRVIKMTQWQIDKLTTLDFLDDETNIIISGTAGVGKTHIASSIGNVAVDKGIKTFYITLLNSQ